MTNSLWGWCRLDPFAGLAIAGVAIKERRAAWRGENCSCAAVPGLSEQLELATARWVEWYNQRRLHSSIGDVPPAEFEATYYRERAVSAVA